MRGYAGKGGARAAWLTLLAAIAGTVLCAGGLSAAAAQQPAGAVAGAALAGTVLAGGLNDSGQLGDGGTTDSSVPVAADMPAGTRVTAVAAGLYHSLALTSGGSVLAWGDDLYGQLGDGGNGGSFKPVAVDPSDGAPVTAIAAGYFHSLAATSDGRVLAWGGNGSGQLGDGTTMSSSTPVAVHLPEGVHVTAVAAGLHHSLALTSGGQVLAWGGNADGQLGDGTTAGSTAPVLVRLPYGVRVIAIAAGEDHSLALTSGSQVLAWGSNSSGQLGDGKTAGSTVPSPVNLPAGVQIAGIAAGGAHSLAVTCDGQVLAWGSNSSGQLGDGKTAGSTVPVQVRLPAGTFVTAVAGGSNFSVAVTCNRRVLSWGGNGSGQLGDGTTAGSTVPVQVRLPAGTQVTTVAGGGHHVLTLPAPAATPAAATVTDAIAVTAAPGRARTGQPVTVTATVSCSGAAPAGTVTFRTAAGVLGSVTLAGGRGTLATTGLPAGRDEITGHFNGNRTCLAATSRPVTVTVADTPDTPPAHQAPPAQTASTLPEVPVTG